MVALINASPVTSKTLQTIAIKILKGFVSTTGKEVNTLIGKKQQVKYLRNHGIIGLSGSPAGVMASLMMAETAAKIFVGAAALGGPVFLTPENVARISGRSDEHYRRKVLKL